MKTFCVKTIYNILFIMIFLQLCDIFYKIFSFAKNITYDIKRPDVIKKKKGNPIKKNIN